MKETSLTLRTFLLGLACLLTGSLIAQDIHFSQFSNSPINLNPGLAGVYGGDMRFVGNYRKQWQTVPVPYTTFSGSMENKVYWSKGHYDRYLTGGILFNYDRQGTLNLTSLQIGIPISVTVPVAKNNFLTVGIKPAFGQRSFSKHKLTFDEQWNDCMFDPNSIISENIALTNTSLKYFDLSAGFNYRWQAKMKRTRFDVGLGWHHINRPYHDFWASSLTDAGNVRLYDKKSGYILGLMQLTNNWDLMAQGIYQQQGGYFEMVYGGGLRLHLNKQPYNELALQVGVDYRSRFEDALIPHIEVLYRTWTLGITYDINIWSDVNLVTNKKAGPEVALIYRLYHMKPLAKTKSCAIF